MIENKQSNPEKMSNEEQNTHFQFDVTWKKILVYVSAQIADRATWKKILIYQTNIYSNVEKNTHKKVMWKKILNLTLCIW